VNRWPGEGAQAFRGFGSPPSHAVAELTRHPDRENAEDAGRRSPFRHGGSGEARRRRHTV